MKIKQLFYLGILIISISFGKAQDFLHLSMKGPLKQTLKTEPCNLRSSLLTNWMLRP